MYNCPLARLPLDNAAEKAVDEEPHKYFVFQCFRALSGFKPLLPSDVPFVQLKWSCVFGVFLGRLQDFLGTLSRWMLCDLRDRSLDTLWLTFYNGPGIWASFSVTWLPGLFPERSKTSKNSLRVQNDSAQFFHCCLLLQAQSSCLFSPQKIGHGFHSLEQLKS